MNEMAPTAERILDAAQSLVVAGGYNGFSYADIADAIGIRKASIHHHFPSKAELISALVDRYTRRADAGLKSLREQKPNPVEQLQAYVNFWQTCIRDASVPFCVCAMLASEIQMLPPEAVNGVRAYFRILAGWLTAVLREGAERDMFCLGGLPDEEAQILMATVHGAMLSARALDDPNIFGVIVDPQIARLMAPTHL